MSALETFERMLAQGRDSALLRYSLGNEYMKADHPCDAIVHLREAVRLDPDHSASWKLLGKALADSGRASEALDVYREGIATAERLGDVQAMKEMRVFLRRVEKQLAQG